MTEFSFAHTALEDSSEAGTFLGKELKGKLGNQSPDMVLVFSSSRFQPQGLLAALQASTEATHIVGCTCAGEFIQGAIGTGSISALAIRSDEMRFSIGLGRNIDRDPEAAIDELISGLTCGGDYAFPFRTLLVLTDALAGQAQEMIDILNQKTGAVYQIFGGGAGDDAKFESTEVFRGCESFSKAVVALEICSKKPIGIGISHGWMPATPPMRVTQASGARLITLNASPAVEVFRNFAKETGQPFDLENPLPFFLHNIIGIQTAHGMKLRVPLKLEADGSVVCAAEVPEGATIRIMSSTEESTTEAACKAATTALDGLRGAKPKAAIFFDCVATRLKMGKAFGNELDALSDALGHIPYVGCNTYGQIARVDGQFNGFHNCTAVVCVIPE
ncbi:MAG: FIST C-terminal domain-containing protein [Fibrobacterota bacterium]|nr:FIST C-terminal domain-containing protein [Fibrobacterota bacterium]